MEHRPINKDIVFENNTHFVIRCDDFETFSLYNTNDTWWENYDEEDFDIVSEGNSLYIVIDKYMSSVFAEPEDEDIMRKFFYTTNAAGELNGGEAVNGDELGIEEIKNYLEKYKIILQ